MTQAEMPPNLPPLVHHRLQRLIRAFAPERIVLFGSYSKGTCMAAAMWTSSSLPASTAIRIFITAGLANWLPLLPTRGRPLRHPRRPSRRAATAKSLFLLSILGRGITL